MTEVRSALVRGAGRATLASMAVLSAVAIQAQGLAVDRSHVLAVTGVVDDTDLPLGPLETDLGRVFTREISEPGATSVRLLLVVENGTGHDATWGIKVRDADGVARWSVWGGDVEGDRVWSDTIPGERFKVEVYSARPANPVLLRIDKVVSEREKNVPLSITGENHLRPIQGQDRWIIDAGQSVARLRFVGDDGKSYVCTAFLVTKDLMLTNHHCISSDSERESALIDFDFDSTTARPMTVGLKELLQNDLALDYALVRLERPVDREPLRLGSAPPADHEQLLIIQHPAGEPKQVSLRDCEVDGVNVAGWVDPDTDFGHLCDTKGGSSGSPVFQTGTKTVVGLHHLGFDPHGTQLFNRAVHMDQVMANLYSGYRSEIVAGQP